MQYSELQQKGFEVAKRYEALPLQDRLNIIAETFGCKTASVRTSPCTGKWSGYSDIYLDLDNGAALGIGTERTPQAQSDATISECVNNTLARYNPEIISEIKARAAAALSKREAEDNAAAALRGLKPYTFLNVELNDGSDGLSGAYAGWYYATLAVDGKILAFIESGLAGDISRGVVGEDGRPDYFVAGALEADEVDFIFHNVGHSTSNGLYQINLSGDARERAEKTLKEKISAKTAVEVDLPLSDPSPTEYDPNDYDYGYGEEEYDDEI